MFKQINQISEQAMFIDFGDNINIETSKIVSALSDYLLKNLSNLNSLGIRNIVPSYNKLLVQFDNNVNNKHKIINYLNNIDITKLENKSKTKIVEIPICYDEEYAIDLQYISNLTKLPKKKIINIHLNTIFHVYMIGFMPGLPFMGNLDKQISLSRKLNPRINVKKGSVGIIDRLCVIYPNDSPGGWNIIGRTPINLFFKDKKNSCLLKSGYKIKFKKILKSKFIELKNTINNDQ